jgi:ergothioneine biosynthesis protein EgtB
MSTPLAADQSTSSADTHSSAALAERFCEVRAWSEQLCEPLQTEDYVVQSMPDCSPTKWHLTHTSWFFETFVLKNARPDYQARHPQYNFLFNSYYNAVGERHCRPQRGLLSRPTVEETFAYRADIDDHMLGLLNEIDEEQLKVLSPLIVLGFHHEQQHQELMLTDLKHMFASNPLHPVYRERQTAPKYFAAQPHWEAWDASLYEIGYNTEQPSFDGFAFDNESPRHRQWLEAWALSSRLVTCGDYLEFMVDGGYSRPELWLSMGWNTVQQQGWEAPLYWEKRGGAWWQMTLSGMRLVENDEPVCHVSFFEADAYARWKAKQEPGVRLPSEAEWEIGAQNLPLTGSFAESKHFHPVEGEVETPSLQQMFGEVWQWTRSAYLPYPGYVADEGALGEYNGKFMCNQWVLRGGSCATPRSHIRSTYRNFFPPEARWQFSGIRLAKDL